MADLRTITVHKRDGTSKSVQSPYGDGELLNRLAHHIDGEGEQKLARSSFACDLLRKGFRYGLSAKQAAWAHVLVIEAETEAAPTAAASLPGIRAVIDRAAGNLQHPKINVTTEGGQPLRLSRTGERSRTPGVIHVTDGRPYGSNTWFGKIDLDGEFIPSRSITPEVQAFLVEFDADPAAQAAAYGHRTGSCCFCSRELTDSRSVGVGYGPVCAESYGLPWGS